MSSSFFKENERFFCYNRRALERWKAMRRKRKVLKPETIYFREEHTELHDRLLDLVDELRPKGWTMSKMLVHLVELGLPHFDRNQPPPASAARETLALLSDLLGKQSDNEASIRATLKRIEAIEAALRNTRPSRR